MKPGRKAGLPAPSFWRPPPASPPWKGANGAQEVDDAHPGPRHPARSGPGPLLPRPRRGCLLDLLLSRCPRRLLHLLQARLVRPQLPVACYPEPGRKAGRLSPRRGRHLNSLGRQPQGSRGSPINPSLRREAAPAVAESEPSGVAPSGASQGWGGGSLPGAHAPGYSSVVPFRG
jgi:hypothetical protein